MDHAHLARVLARQDGVVSRRQVVGTGGDDNVIEAAVRRRRWARLYDGV